jgi:hypothetical protein
MTTLLSVLLVCLMCCWSAVAAAVQVLIQARQVAVVVLVRLSDSLARRRFILRLALMRLMSVLVVLVSIATP